MYDQSDRAQPGLPAAAVHASLHGWARGAYGDEAAVELLIRSFGGRFAPPGWPWVAPRERPGEYWLDAEAIHQATGQLSGGEQRVLAVIAALTGSQLLERNLPDVMSGVDRVNQTLILAALSHAGGSHQHSDYQRQADGTYTIIEVGALFPWPNARWVSDQEALPLTDRATPPLLPRTSGVPAERRAGPGRGFQMVDRRFQV